ncbi:MAG: cupin domain-containing protein [Pseudomonadota bacterium]
MTQQIIDFRTKVPGETSTPAADRLLAGNPQQSVSNYFSDATQQFHSGTWSSTVGTWRIRYSESEFCCLTRGRVALENLTGQRWEFGVGEGFVVPAGFEGTWQVIEDCTKFYAIFEART